MSIDSATPNEWDAAAYWARMADTSARSELTPMDIERLNQMLARSFGELPLVTRAYVFLLHQMRKVQVFRAEDPETAIYHPNWLATSPYQVRAVEKPKTKPSIDWAHVAPQYKWLARDEDGSAWCFTAGPAQLDSGWYKMGLARADFLSSYVAGDCDWKDSLVERPAGV